MARPPTLPLLLGNGTIEALRPLGSGAGGFVCAGRDTRLGTPRAIKLAPCEGPGVERFLAEARYLQGVDHDRIVRVHDRGTDEPWCWYAMTLYPRTLARALRKPVDAEQALEWALQCLEGVAVLHRSGLVHRDLKPENLFLDAKGDVVVGDLGVARQPIGSVAWETGTGSDLGTLGYAAPEQSRDSKRVGRAADVYAVGAVLFHMLAGVRPTGLFAHEEIPAIFDPLPERYHELVGAACALEPEHRPATARALAERVAEVRDAVRADRGAVPRAAERMAAFDARVPRESWLARRWKGLKVALDGR